VIEPESLFAAFVGVLALAAGIDLGLAFLMRGEREATTEHDR
jgi:hypothetical protein